MKSFQNQVCLLTGASSGIGEALARALLDRGARLGLMARTEPRLRELEALAPDRVQVCLGDVQSRAACLEAVARTRDRFGPLSCVIHNAGVSMRALARESSFQVYETLMATNFYALVHLYHGSVDDLVAQKGSLVAISSMMGQFSSQLRSGYCASKHAVRGFMDAVRLEHAAQGLHCLTVSPGFIRTNVSLNALAADGQPFAKKTTNIDLGLDPALVAGQVLGAILARERDIFPSTPRERFALVLSRLSPGLLDRILVGQDVT